MGHKGWRAVTPSQRCIEAAGSKLELTIVLMVPLHTLCPWHPKNWLRVLVRH